MAVEGRSTAWTQGKGIHGDIALITASLVITYWSSTDEKQFYALKENITTLSSCTTAFIFVVLS